MKTCPHCGIEHQKDGTFCSRSCGGNRSKSAAWRAAMADMERGRHPRVVVECFTCGAEILKQAAHVRRHLRGIFFCDKKCQDSPVARDKGYTSGPNCGAGHTGYRNRALRHYGAVCKICGYTGPAIEVDHIDGDRGHSKLGNLQVLCATHHREKTLMGQDYILKQMLGSSSLIGKATAPQAVDSGFDSRPIHQLQ